MFLKVDVKIASKALTPGLKKILPQIIHVDQYADIKGKAMFDPIHTIDNIIQNIKGQQNVWVYGCFQFNS